SAIPAGHTTATTASTIRKRNTRRIDGSPFRRVTRMKPRTTTSGLRVVVLATRGQARRPSEANVARRSLGQHPSRDDEGVLLRTAPPLHLLLCDGLHDHCGLVDFAGGADARFEGALDPRVVEACVLAREVHTPLRRDDVGLEVRL